MILNNILIVSTPTYNITHTLKFNSRERYMKHILTDMIFQKAENVNNLLTQISNISLRDAVTFKFLIIIC